MIHFLFYSVSLANSVYFSLEQEDPIKILNFAALQVPDLENYSVYLQQISHPFVPVLMMASKGNSSSCDLKQSIWTCDSPYQDLYSYTLSLSFHYLSLPKGSDWNLKIMTASISSPIQWNLTIVPGLCIEDCKGLCKTGRCVCPSSFVGHDCKVPVFYLTNGTSSKYKLKSSTYHFFRPSKEIEKCVVTKGKANVRVYMTEERVNVNQSNLPTEFYNHYSKEILNETKEFEVRIEKTRVFSFWPDSNVSFIFNCTEFKEKKIKNNALIIMWVLISFTVFVVILWIIVILLRIFKVRLFNFSKTVPKRRFFNENDLKTVHKSFDKEDLCVICLEGFHKGNKIRELDCAHKYHQFCIENWLQTHDYCCVCKQLYKETQTK